MNNMKSTLVFLVNRMANNVFFSGLCIKSLSLLGLVFIQPFHVNGSTVDHNRASQLFQLCGVCHGSEGHGKRDILAPAIAGLPEWYLVNQLKKFRNGDRGAHPDDVAGLKMRPMARVLDIGSRKRNPKNGAWHYENDEEVQAVAQYVANLKPKQPKDVIEGGDPVKGKTLYLNCMGCHGQKSEGMAAMQAPAQTHMEDWYMLEQLKKFKSGQRGAEDTGKYDPTKPLFMSGTQAMAMRGIVMATIPDEQAMKDVIAYIRELGRGSTNEGHTVAAPLPASSEQGNSPAVRGENSTQP